jgi:thiol-disulfide isomerase/thioredoxin
MKKFVFLFALLDVLVFSASAIAQQPAARIEVKINGYDGKEVFLGYRRADKVYSKDTIALANGKYVYESQEPLFPGIYLILMPPDNKFFEFVVTKSEQKFSVETTAPDFYKNLKIKGSKDNQLLLDYQHYMAEQVEISKKVQEEMAATTDEKQKEKLQKQLEDIAKAVRTHQNKVVKDNPGTYTSKLILAFQEPEIPEPPKDADGTAADAFRFRYFRSHYWDGFDFSDEIFTNTPYLKEKMDRYLDKMTLQSADSVIAAVDLILGKAQANEEVFKYCLPYLLNKYYTPEIMGLDAVYVHLSDNYYKTGIADWVTEENLKKITDDALMMRGVLIGKKAPDIRVQRYDPAEDKFTSNLISPYDVKADYTVIFLWKPGCGHCKHMTEELKPFYEEWKNKGVEIFSITSANHTELSDAIKDIHEKNMPWIITADPYMRARALQNYFGTSLPKLYILDKDKKVIANRVGVKQLPEIITNHRKVTGQDR